MKIKKYDKKYIDSFVKLIDESFNIKNKNKKELVEWKFHTEKFFHKNRIICAYKNDKIVGQYSNITYEFIKKNFIIKGYICQDMCILKDYRGQGLISKMSKKLYSNIEEKTFTIGFSNKHGVKVDKNSKGYGYNIIDNLVSFYFPTLLNSDGYNFEEINNSSQIEKIDFNNFNFFDDLLKINKTEEFIKWRYFDNPNSNYNFYIIKFNNQIIGYYIFRIQNKIAILFDFDCKKGINKKKFISTFKNISIKKKCLIFKIILLENIFWNNLFKGFFKLKKNEEIYFTLKNHNKLVGKSKFSALP
ncbi:MAG: GNAT family N-acetyltransferase [Candidatus Gracilibacteria bacterium]|nr:GNAT family N-acetyltransferase [Candidatus Gracilibacteria bacterium]MDQ7022117.1 GNAT family N-acetyltransferase [Candidatus Gracilibacteria bacterium]